MPASRSSAESSNSLLYVLVVFIVLFLAAAVFAVVMYLNTESLKNAADTATQERNKLASSKDLREVKPFMSQRGKTVIGQMGADMKYMAGVIGGEEMQTLTIPEVKVAVQKKVEPVFTILEQLGKDLMEKEKIASAANMSPKTGLVGVSTSLMQITDELLGQRNDARLLAGQLQKQLTQKDQEYGAKIAQLQSDLAKAAAAAKTGDAAYQKQVEFLRNQYEKEIAQLTKQKTQLQAEKDKLQKTNEQLQQNIAKLDKRRKELEKMVQQFRPNPEMETAALQPDGYIVSVNTRDKLAYINLAREDHIYRGLTFTVYDSYQAIPKSGQGKATIEVIEIMDKISKCQIIKDDPTNPILKKDIIANLVWSKDKRYQFCVIGDFDTNGDGKIDTDGRSRIKNMITNWGGVVVDTVSVDTDFLVVGYPPKIPVRPKDENSPAMEVYRKAIDKAATYKDILNTGSTLGVPTFNPSRFYAFIGYQPKIAMK